MSRLMAIGKRALLGVWLLLLNTAAANASGLVERMFGYHVELETVKVHTASGAECSVDYMKTIASLYAFYWTGSCSGGRLNGRGHLVHYSDRGEGYDSHRYSNPGPVWDATFRRGRLSELFEYESSDNWKTWTITEQEVSNDWFLLSKTIRYKVPRHLLPDTLQATLNKFIELKPIAGFSAQAVGLAPAPIAQCPDSIDVVDSKGNPVTFDLAAYVRSKGSADAARAEISARLANQEKQLHGPNALQAGHLATAYKKLAAAIACGK